MQGASARQSRACVVRGVRGKFFPLCSSVPRRLRLRSRGCNERTCGAMRARIFLLIAALPCSTHARSSRNLSPCPAGSVEKQCMSDGGWYCCADQRCNIKRNCASNPGLLHCACPRWYGDRRRFNRQELARNTRPQASLSARSAGTHRRTSPQPLPPRPAHTAGTSPQPLPQRPAHTGATSPQPPYRSLLPPSATPTLTTSPPSPPQPSSWWQKDSRGGKLEHDEGTTEAICLSDPPPPDGDPDPCARTRGVAMPVRCRKPRTSALSDVLYDWDSVRCSA